MDIESDKMEEINLEGVKALANNICSMYFFHQKDCEKRAEEAILEASNYINDDPIKHLATMAIITLRYYGKTKDLFQTFSLNDNALIFSLDMIAKLREFPYKYSLTPLSYELCRNLSKDPGRCINTLGYLTFWHDIHMHTISFKYNGAPIDDEFIHLLNLLVRNIVAQYLVTEDVTIAEKSAEVVSEFIKKIIQEIKETDKEKKKNKEGNKKEEEEK